MHDSNLRLSLSDILYNILIWSNSTNNLFLQCCITELLCICVFFSLSSIRYVEEHIQRTGVAIETQGFSFVTSGRKRESLTVSPAVQK